MALSLGSSLATKVYLGATEINLAYFGATQVYSSSAFSAEAQNYFSRLDTAGDTTYVDYKQPLANYIDGLVTNGLWNGLLSAACFVGVGFQGMLVPLKSGMPTLTNNFFLGADLDQLNGLLGDGSTKYLGTGITKNDLLQNDLSMSVYFTQAGTPNNVQAFIGATTTALIQLNASSNTPRIANSGGSFNDIDRGVGFFGASRDNSAGFDIRFKGTDYASTETSVAISGTTELSVFARTTSLFSDWGIGTYHIGTSVGAAGLITLETLQATLITEVAEAQFSAEAANYFARLAVAGDTTHYAYRQPLANYIDGLVALGGAYWDTMVSAASFVGVGIQGVTVPLRAGMTVATNNNFVDTDLDQLIGLKGDASTKYITTGVVGGDLLLDDNSLSVYLTEGRETGGGRYISGEAARYTMLGNATGARARSVSNNIQTLGASTALNKLIGISRNNSADFDWRYETSGTITDASFLLSNVNINVFADSSGANKVAARLATYHIGPALNLATLEALQDTLLSEVAAAKAAAAAENYFSRLAAAGDTTHVAYKQPLTNYISSLVALGGAYWDDMLSACSFVGVGIQGVTVPLRAGMTVPTNNNFVAGDLDVLTGLQGGNTKELATGILDNQLTDSNASASVYATVAGTSGAHLSNDYNPGGVNFRIGSTSNLRGAAYVITSSGVTGLIGLTRTTNTDLDGRANQTDITAANAGVPPRNSEIFVLSRNASQFANSRLATYHIGPALNLATLEGLQDTLITEIAAI